jgi:hypothetical protein
MAAPDLWLLALMQLMVEAIIQGVTWDGTKLLLGQALDTLRGNHLAPPVRKSSRTTSEYRFESYVDFGMLIRLFIKLQHRREVKGFSSMGTQKTKTAKTKKGPATRRKKKKKRQR